MTPNITIMKVAAFADLFVLLLKQSRSSPWFATVRFAGVCKDLRWAHQQRFFQQVVFV